MRTLSGRFAVLILGYAALAALGHLWIGGTSAMELVSRLIGTEFLTRGIFFVPDPLELRGFHLGVLMPLVFLLYPARPGRSPEHRPSFPDWVLAVICVLPSLYILVHAQEINARMEFIDPLTDLQFWLGAIAMVLLLEAIRRAVAPVLAVIVMIGLLYMYAGRWLPGILNTRPFDIPAIVETVYYVPIVGGIYGPLTGIVASTISMFILFGAFVQGSGTGRLFSNFGAAVAGRYAGGPAKVAVITSGLFGTMSGSTVSNVVTTGAITIPMMKGLGYRPAVAGGIEAAASTGGALMPPVMGAAAFVMSEITQIPYSDIIIAAAVGAVLYYFAIFVSVHFEAKRVGLASMSDEDVPSWREVGADWHLVLPIIALVWFLMQRWSGNFSAFVAVVASVAAAALKARTRMGFNVLLETLSSAACTMALLAVAVAGAGVITSALTVTGLVVAFGGIVKGLAGGSLALLCILLMITALVLGMGVPTTPAYIITAALGSPILRDYGVDLLPAHLFMFYFAVLADATPPVAVASYAAAAIAGANPITTGLHALRFALAGFVVGYGFIYDQGIMLRADFVSIIEQTLLLGAALVLLGAGLARHLRARLTWPASALAIVIGATVAFGHALPDDVRLVLGFGTLAVMASLPGLFAPREGTG